MLLELRLIRHCRWAVVLFSLVSGGALRAQTLTDLGDLGGGFSQARGVNNLGQVVGDATTANGTDEAFLYSNGILTNLGTLGAYTFPNGGLDGGGVDNSSQAYGINDSGQIVGQSTTTDSQSAAFLYTGGQMVNIVPVGSARDINNSGQIVGLVNVGVNGNTSAFLYTNQTLTTFGGTYSFASAINASGQVTGYAQNSTGNGDAFLYSNGTLQNVATLGVGRDINNSGEIAGGSSVYLNGQIKTLGTFLTGVPLSAYNSSNGTAINNLGQVVGTATAISTPQEQVNHAFIYSDTTGLQDLDKLYASLLVNGKGSTPGFTNLDLATDINDLGQIVGYGEYWTGTRNEIQAFLLTPAAAPEPASWILGVSALGWMIVMVARIRLSQRNV